MAGRWERYAGLVLAAGASRRLGGMPKALVELDGRTAVERVLDQLSRAGVEPVAVVVGAHAEAIARHLRGRPVAVVVNPDWERGRTGSVHAGLEWAGAADGVVLAPVDHPFFRASTVQRTADVGRSDPLALWISPTFGGRGGHPVLVKAAAFGPIRSLGPDAPLRTVPAHLGVQARRLEVDDAGVVLGTDTMEEVRRGREYLRNDGRGPWIVD